MLDSHRCLFLAPSVFAASPLSKNIFIIHFSIFHIFARRAKIWKMEKCMMKIMK